MNIKHKFIQRSKKLVAYTKKRMDSGLGSKSDYLQAKASLKQRVFELENSYNTLNKSSREFNSFRQLDSPKIQHHQKYSEKLSSFTSLKIRNYNRINQEYINRNLSKIYEREDLKSKLENLKQLKAKAEAQTQTIMPDIKFAVKYYPSGRNVSYSSTASDAWRLKHNTYNIGVNFTVPLDYSLIKNLQSAYKRDATAAALDYSRDRFILKNEWLNLIEQHNIMLHQTQQSKSIVLVQREKLLNEQEKLKRGKTTTFQVIQFQQDYLASQEQYLITLAGYLKVTALLRLFT